ncbi:MAG: hypothetical protein D6696_12655 [Acidobacteria bacterium]|nr:MAG: hypothetical protein D6696_12655 [Acidobacteriota bacterium]
MRSSLLALAILAAGAFPASGDAPPSPVLEAMKQELERSLAVLGKEPQPPYYLSYEITDSHRYRVAAAFGSITASEESRHRWLDVDLRVGDYELDNTHQIRGGFDPSDFADRFRRVAVPLADDADAIRSVLWYQTDERYKRARERLTRVKTNVQVKVEEEDRSADFSREPAETYREPLATVELDRAAWEEKLRAYTAPFSRYGVIYQAQAFVDAEAETRFFVNSDGSEIQVSQPRYRLFLYALTKADDGMELPRYESYYATSLAGLPDDATVEAAVARMIEDLLALRQAPLVDPYAGPAILSGRAAGVFFHEVFGHRVEGHRLKDEGDAQTFKKKIGEEILPAGFSVIFDPTISSYHGFELNGHYRFDNQGVRARPVKVVENGVFKRFLMSRSPIEGFDHSNGHGRKQAGFQPVARQSNLLVEVADPLSPQELRRRLIELLEEQDKPFGLIFEDIQGGFTMTGRTIPNAFNVLPILVYRLYRDGREELVRGVDLIGTPLAAFSKVVAADTEVGVFNGTCGAESGGVPVAAASPALLVSQIEVQKKTKSQERAPILPAPFADEPEVAEPRRTKG